MVADLREEALGFCWFIPSFVFITERRIIQEEKRESVRICEKLVSGICFSLEDHEWTEMDKARLSIR